MSFMKRFSERRDRRLSLGVDHPSNNLNNFQKGDVVEASIPYASNCEDELNIPAGVKLKFLEQDDNGWARGEINGQEGWFPVTSISPRLSARERHERALSCILEAPINPLPSHSAPNSLKMAMPLPLPLTFAAAKPSPLGSIVVNSIDSPDSIVSQKKQTSEALNKWLANQRPTKEVLKEKNILQIIEEEDKKPEKKKKGSFLKFRRKKNSFGVSIAELTQDPSERIPKIVTCFVTYLREHGITQEGIFRVSGSTKDVLDLRKKIDSSGPFDFADYPKPHVIATLFKRFFSNLPEPLFTYELYSDFINCYDESNSSQTLESLKTQLVKLPPINLRLARYLFKFLSDVSGNVSVNKMGPSNLALIFAPNILKPQTQTTMSMFDTKNCALVELIINSYSKIFEGEAPETTQEAPAAQPPVLPSSLKITAPPNIGLKSIPMGMKLPPPQSAPSKPGPPPSSGKQFSSSASALPVSRPVQPKGPPQMTKFPSVPPAQPQPGQGSAGLRANANFNNVINNLNSILKPPSQPGQT